MMSTSTDENVTAARLPGTVKSAPPDARGIDTGSKLASTVLAELAGVLGYKFVVRYVSRAEDEASGDLDHSEALSILNHGLALMVVQHVEQSGWTPSAAKGTQYGRTAAKHAADIGLPAGVNVWLDLEGVAKGTAATTVIDYSNHWAQAVRDAGFAPGVYVGFNTFLTASQLGALSVDHFWKSASDVPSPTGHGYQMIQHQVVKVLGVDLDVDVTQNDSKHKAVQWLVK